MIEKIVPAWGWLRRYERGHLRADLLAGLTVAVMLVPQAMAYAMLAGLPPVVGLYACVAPLMVYALFGSSRQLAVGPVAIISLLVAAKCSALAKPGSQEYLTLVLLLALLVGLAQLALGLLRAGFLLNFLSRAVIAGFTSAAALIICFSQLKHLLGIPLAQGDSVFTLAAEAAVRIGQTSPITLAVGGASIAVLALFRKRWPRFPSAMTVVILATLLVWLLRLDTHGVAVVGAVPGGLPGFSPPKLDWHAASSLAPTAITIALVGFLESIAIAQSIAAREKYRVDPNQELRALGLANVAAGLFSGYPVTGGFSRTAVSYSAGAKTLLASLVTAAAVVLTLLFLTPLFHYLPKAVLAAVVIVAVVGLIEVKEGLRLYKVKRADGVTFLVTFLATLILDVEPGVLTGVALSLALFVWRSSRPHMAELGYVAEEGVFRDLARYPNARTYPNVLILRVDASLYFANARFVEDRLRQRLAERQDVAWVLLDMSAANDIDATAVSTLEELIDDYQPRGIGFAFAGMKARVRDLVARAGWKAKYGKRVEYASLKQALEDVL
ncbi:MAG TPA: sulfate permease [Thermoguttaceae bacterium]|nr:sulfate permease [Thermoguttaceae bacterium]